MILSTMASAIRGYYCLRRADAQQIDYYKPSAEKYDKHWGKAADACADLGAEPQEYIDVLFSWMKPWPYITQVAAPSFTEAFKELREDLEVHTKDRIKLSHGALLNGLSAGIDVQEFLTDTMQNFDPLFIFYTLSKRGFTELAEEYRDRAQRQMDSRFLFKEIYKGVMDNGGANS